MQDMFVSLIGFFLVEPLLQEVAGSLAAARAPREVVATVVTCATENGPEIVGRALDDPWWVATSAIGLWVGFADPADLLAEAAPGCVAAVDAARPFLEARDGQGG